MTGLQVAPTAPCSIEYDNSGTDAESFHRQVAVEAVIIYNFFNQRLARISIETKLLVEEFLEALRDQDKDKDKDRDGARQAS